MKMQWIQKGLAVLALVAFIATGAYAASFYSDQITNSDITVPAVKNSPNTQGFPIRQYWSFTTPTTGTTPIVSDIVSLVRIPANARILGAKVWFGSLASGSFVAIGYPGSIARYSQPTAAGVAGGGFFNTAATGVVDLMLSPVMGLSQMGEVLTKDQIIQMTIGGATLNNGQPMAGYFEYLQQ